jgi:sugar (pentulose or hexulose) kinase
MPGRPAPGNGADQRAGRPRRRAAGQAHRRGRRSRLWPQILADVLGCPVGVAEHTESAALGAAILAGRAAGVLAEDPPLGSRPHGVMRPRPAGQQVYARLYARWRSADQRN